MTNLSEKIYIKNKKVLLIGGEGFVGRNIAEIVTGCFSCYSIGNKKSFFLERKDIFIEINPYTEKNIDEFDVYIHLIDNQVELGVFSKEEEKMIENVGIKSGKHLIIFSSAVVYANPGSSYGKRKRLLEEFYEEYCKTHKINLTILRLFNTYGKYQIPYKQGSLIANVFYNYMNNKPVEINDIAAMRDFIYAEDIGTIVKWIIKNKFFGKADLATGKLISIKELLNVFAEKIFLHKVEIINKNIKERNLCPTGGSELYDNIKSTHLVEGLRKTLYFYETQSDEIKKYLNI